MNATRLTVVTGFRAQQNHLSMAPFAAPTFSLEVALQMGASISSKHWNV